MFNNGNASYASPFGDPAEVTIRLKQRTEEIDQCPQCGIMGWEAEQVHGRSPRYIGDGIIDCPECREAVFVRKDSASGTAELLEGDKAESISQQVRECLAEDAQRGVKGGGGGSSGRSRKKPFRGPLAPLVDDSGDWNSNDAVGIVEIKVVKVTYNEARLTLELHEETMKRLEFLARHYKDTPSMAVREAIRQAEASIESPDGTYVTAEPLEDFSEAEGPPKRAEFRLPGDLKEVLVAAARDNEVTYSQAAEDMILRLYLNIKHKGDRR